MSIRRPPQPPMNRVQRVCTSITRYTLVCSFTFALFVLVFQASAMHG